MAGINHKHLHRRQAGDEGAEAITKAAVEARTKTHVVYTTLDATFEGKPDGYYTLGVPEPAAATAEPTEPAAPEPTAEEKDLDVGIAAVTAAEDTQNEPNGQPQPTRTRAALATAEEAVAEPTVNTGAGNTKGANSANNGGNDNAGGELNANNVEDTPSKITDPAHIDIDKHNTLLYDGSNTMQTSKSDVSSSSQTDVATTTAAISSPTSSSDSGSSNGGTNNTAVIAGAVLGALGGLLILGLLAWLLMSRRKKENEEEKANEKFDANANPFADPHQGAAAAVGRPPSVQTSKTSRDPPQVQLRPVTQFMPNFGERRSSKGAAIALTTPNLNPERSAGQSAWERPSTSRGNTQENPFGSNAESSNLAAARPVSPISYNGTTGRSVSPVSPLEPDSNNPFDDPANVGMASTSNAPIGAAVTAGAGAGAAAGPATGLARSTSTRKQNPEPLILANNARHEEDIPTPPSPAGTEFSMASLPPGQTPGPSRSADAIHAAGGPAATTVHRVQLEFIPTLEDEIDLREGQLVRLLHEYDDGWALCIRLDRSKQGVCPRTCLSTRPVKPRPVGPPGARNGPPIKPNGPPRGPPRGPMPPGARPMTPQGGPGYGRPESPMRPPMGPGRPQSPAMRPHSPGMGPHSPAHGRPMSPASGRGPRGPGPRPHSPGPRQQRPNSPSGMNRRHTPPGPSPMNPNNQSGPRSPTPDGGGIPGQAY